MSVAKDVDNSLKIFDAVKNGLTLGPEKATEEFAKKYANFAVEMYTYVKDRPELQSALAGAKSTYDAISGGATYNAAMSRSVQASGMDLAKTAARSAKFGAYAAGGVIGVFIDSMAGVARALKIEMNECALAVTKLVIDIIAGLALLASEVGAILGALQLLQTAADGKDAYQACFPSK